MTAETHVLETAPDMTSSALMMDIATGLHVPSYDEFVAYGAYFIAGFQEHRSSMDNGVRAYTHNDSGNKGDKVSLASDAYDQAQAAAKPDHWLLGATERADIDTLLGATNLREVPGHGRHRAYGAPDEEAETLRALQDQARDRVELDRRIRLAQVWADSRHGARLGLSGTMPSSKALETLAHTGLKDRLNYVAPAKPLSAESRRGSSLR